jgi:hypothetical protein
MASRRRTKIKKNVVHVVVKDDKRSVSARISRAGNIKRLAPSSALYAGATKSTGDDVVKAGDALTGADQAVRALETQLANARSSRDLLEHDFDKSYDLYVANAEHVCQTPADAEALALVVKGRQIHALVVPALAVKPDPKNGAVSFHAKGGTPRASVIIEIASDPPAATGFTRLKGDGARRSATNLAAGKYLARAASAMGQTESPFSEPVPFTVR